MATPTIRPAIPIDLRKELPDPWIPWGISERLFQEMQNQKSVLYKRAQVLPTDPEWRFVWRYFHQDKPARYGIKRIYCVHERHQQQAFELHLSSIEREADKCKPSWHEESRADQRAVAIERWKQSAQLFSLFKRIESNGQLKNWEKAKILPLWHGSSKEMCHSISESGFVCFGKTSFAGEQVTDLINSVCHFGLGIYFTNSARYASDIYAQGHLLLAWVSMYEPFPVVGDLLQQDMCVLKGKGAYKDYNAHCIPLQSDPNCTIYSPCQVGEAPICDELVIFHKSQALPRFWVELEVELPYLMTPSNVPLFVNELIPHLFKILQQPQVDRDLKLRDLFNAELTQLLTLSENEDLQERHQYLFKQLMRLIDSRGEIDRAVYQQLIEPASFLLEPDADLKKRFVRSILLKVLLKEARNKVRRFAFGADKWKRYFGDVGEEPLLPAYMHSILVGPCPIWPGKKVQQTHLLVLVPQKVDGKALTLNLLRELIQKPKEGHKTNYRCYWDEIESELGDLPAPASHWVLMMREVLPDGMCKSGESFSQFEKRHQKLVISYAEKSGWEYAMPTVLEAATAILMEHVGTGKRLYSDEPWRYTRCQEKVNNNLWGVFVGGFSLGGLALRYDDICSSHGVALARKL